jgi:hypothetical protein
MKHWAQGFKPHTRHQYLPHYSVFVLLYARSGTVTDCYKNRLSLKFIVSDSILNRDSSKNLIREEGKGLPFALIVTTTGKHMFMHI